MKKHKGDIFHIEEIENNFGMVRYQITISTDKKPELTLGDVELIQQ